MKRRVKVILLLAFVLVNLAVLGYSWQRGVMARVSTSPPPKPPALVVAETDFQFGARDPGESLRHVFVLRNEGSGPLRIKAVRSARPELIGAHASPHIVPPRGEAKLVAQLRLGRAGETQGEVTLETNDPERPLLSFTLTGQAHSRIEIEPKRLDLGSMLAGQVAEGVLEVRAKEGLTVKVEETRTSSAQLKAVVEEVTPGERYRVRVSVQTPAAAGPFAGWVHIITDQRAYKLLAVPVVGRVVLPAAVRAAGL